MLVKDAAIVLFQSNDVLLKMRVKETAIVLIHGMLVKDASIVLIQSNGVLLEC